MLFLFCSNTNFQFSAKKLNQRSYTSVESSFTTRQVEIIDKYEFAKAALNKNTEIFMVYVSAFAAV